MPSTMTFAEIDGQRVEILPARTVLTTIEIGDMTGGDTTASSGDINASQHASGVQGDVWQFQSNETGTADATGGGGVNDIAVSHDSTGGDTTGGDTTIGLGDMTGEDSTASSGDINASQDASDVTGDVWQFQSNETGASTAYGGGGVGDIIVGDDSTSGDEPAPAE